jgi:ribosomal protein S27AE
MFELHPEDGKLHGAAECPACGASVHVVANPDSGMARWCCVACHTVGFAPFRTLSEPAVAPARAAA